MADKEKVSAAEQRIRDRAMQEARDKNMLDQTERAYEASRTTPMKGMAKGGSASSRADGIAQRGKTRGTLVACGGGYMKGKK